MITEPADHTIPEKSPVPPGDMTPSKETPMFPSQRQAPNDGTPDPYQGELESEEDDPVSKPQRLRSAPGMTQSVARKPS